MVSVNTFLTQDLWHACTTCDFITAANAVIEFFVIELQFRNPDEQSQARVAACILLASESISSCTQQTPSQLYSLFVTVKNIWRQSTRRIPKPTNHPKVIEYTTVGHFMLNHPDIFKNAYKVEPPQPEVPYEHVNLLIGYMPKRKTSASIDCGSTPAVKRTKTASPQPEMMHGMMNMFANMVQPYMGQTAGKTPIPSLQPNQQQQVPAAIRDGPAIYPTAPPAMEAIRDAPKTVEDVIASCKLAVADAVHDKLAADAEHDSENDDTVDGSNVIETSTKAKAKGKAKANGKSKPKSTTSTQPPKFDSKKVSSTHWNGGAIYVDKKNHRYRVYETLGGRVEKCRCQFKVNDINSQRAAWDNAIKALNDKSATS